jgi:hypothetical protein
LKNVAGTNVFITFADGIFEIGLREIRPVIKMRNTACFDIHWSQGVDRLGQLLHQSVDAAACRVIGAAQGTRRVRFSRRDLCQHHDNRRFLHVVKNDHMIVESERQIGQVAIVVGRIRQIFNVADCVVAGIADGASHERWQLGQLGDAHGPHAVAEQLERIIGIEMLLLCPAGDRHLAIPSIQ